MSRAVRHPPWRPLNMVVVAMAVALVALWTSVVAADVIFQVPEVLVRHAAVPKPVGTGSAHVRRNISDAWADAETVQLRYEYFVEHAISTADAKKMAMMLKPSDLHEKPPGCGECTKRDMEYCETKVLADHCCCERHFLPEPFPWLPHTCYIGPERCTPLAKNCADYARLRDCCCMTKLREQWRGILSASTPSSRGGITMLVLSAVVVTVYL